MEVEERFWSKVDFDAHDVGRCWPWTARVNRDGYGQFCVSPQMVGAHRVSYELERGSIPAGMELDHLCSLPACVNPWHLEPVSHVENVRRGRVGAANRSKTHCPRGHEYDVVRQRTDGTSYRACRACAREHTRNHRRRTA